MISEICSAKNNGHNVTVDKIFILPELLKDLIKCKTHEEGTVSHIRKDDDCPYYLKYKKDSLYSTNI